MELDYAKIGSFMQEALGKFGEAIGEDDSEKTVEVGEMMIVVELTEKYEDSARTHVTYYCSDARRYIQVGLAMAVLMAAHDNA